MKILLGSISILLLAGCGPSPTLGVINPGQLSPTMREATQELQIIDVVPDKSTVIAAVDATSCKNKFWDPAASNDNALAQLRIKAAALGANALAAVTYEKGGTSMVSNCWESITARGTAIRMNRP